MSTQSDRSSRMHARAKAGAAYGLHRSRFPVGSRVSWHGMPGTVIGHTKYKVRVHIDGDGDYTPLYPDHISPGVATIEATPFVFRAAAALASLLSVRPMHIDLARERASIAMHVDLVSPATFHRAIDVLRSMGAPVDFCRSSGKWEFAEPWDMLPLRVSPAGFEVVTEAGPGTGPTECQDHPASTSPG